jgi:predicted ATPase/DNA-binding SARP family transcriptional activator
MSTALPPPQPFPLLHLLGGLRISGGTTQAAADAAGLQERHHVRCVLALAGSSASGIARDELVDLLWPQSQLTAARNRLYHTLHLARKALAAHSHDAEWITVRDGRVQLHPQVWCDAVALERATAGPLSALSSDALHELLPLCGQEWMPGLDLGAASTTRRSRIQAQQVAVLHEAAQRLSDEGDTPSRRAHLAALLAHVPTDEWAYRELMSLELGAGRPHAVLLLFERLSRTLAQRLGLRPTAATVAVASAATATLQQPQTDPSSLPLLGREGLVRSLVTQMLEQAGVWNITGFSGIGKTALVREVARRLGPAMGDGVVFITLGDLGVVETACAATSRHLGLPDLTDSAATNTNPLAALLGTQRMLLVLDDLDAASDVASWLRLLPHSAMQARVALITHTPLALPAALAHARLFEVPTLAVPPLNASMVQAVQSASVALFQTRCPQALPPEHAQVWMQSVVRLMHRLDGVPLAIELAAARTTTMTPDEILEQIDTSLRPLTLAGNAPADRHHSMQASLDWSAGLFKGTTRSVYQAVSVFAGAFTRAQAQALWLALGVSEDAGSWALQDLLRSGLLAVDTAAVDDASSERLRMLHLPRAHARQSAAMAGIWQQLLSARLVQLEAEISACVVSFESPRCALAANAIATLEADAVGLLEHAQQTDPVRFVNIVAPLLEHWAMRGTVTNVQRWVAPALQAAQGAGMLAYAAWITLVHNNVMRLVDSLVNTEIHSRELMPYLPHLADPVLVARILGARALCLAQVGQTREGLAVLDQEMRARQWQAHEPGFWTVYQRVVFLGHQRNDVHCDFTQLRARFSGSYLWPLLLTNVLQRNMPVGNNTLRLQIAHEQVASARALHSRSMLINGLTHLADAQRFVQDREGALRTMDEAFQILRQVGWESTAVEVRVRTAEIHWRVLALDAAQTCLKEAQAMDSTGFEFEASTMPVHRAIVLMLNQRFDEAVLELRALSATRARQAPDNDLIEWAEALALLCLHKGELRTATELALLLRQLDTPYAGVADIDRFRDERFGPMPDQRHTQGPPDSATSLRLRDSLSQRVVELHAAL